MSESDLANILPTAEEFLRMVYQIRTDAVREVVHARSAGSKQKLRSAEAQLRRAEKLVIKAEKQFGVPHQPA